MGRIGFDAHTLAVAELLPFGAAALAIGARQTALARVVAASAMLGAILQVGAGIAAQRGVCIGAPTGPPLTGLATSTRVAARAAVQRVLRGVEAAALTIAKASGAPAGPSIASFREVAAHVTSAAMAWVGENVDAARAATYGLSRTRLRVGDTLPQRTDLTRAAGGVAIAAVLGRGQTHALVAAQGSAGGTFTAAVHTHAASGTWTIAAAAVLGIAERVGALALTEQGTVWASAHAADAGRAELAHGAASAAIRRVARQPHANTTAVRIGVHAFARTRAAGAHAPFWASIAANAAVVRRGEHVDAYPGAQLKAWLTLNSSSAHRARGHSHLAAAGTCSGARAPTEASGRSHLTGRGGRFYFVRTATRAEQQQGDAQPSQPQRAEV